MNIDWWAIIWQGIGTAVEVWAGVVAANPWPWLGLLVLVLLGLLIPVARRRRRW
jgi:hypothetical protein